jgi:hypothetical protein
MARSTMAELITQVRSLAACGTSDYTLGTAAFWSDDHLQGALDRYRLDLYEQPLSPVPQKAASGTVEYRVYQTEWSNLEATQGGTAVFYLSTSTGARVGTANYTVDYATGRIEFGANQGGTVYYLTARAYDVFAAAADVWRQKAAQVADRFDFSADGASFKASQLAAQYERQAARLEARSGGGVRSVQFTRDDVALWSS